MLLKRTATITLMLITTPVFSQTTLPPKMEGQYSGQHGGGNTYIELIKMENPEKALIKFFVSSSFCNHGIVEGVAEKKENGWQVTAPSNRCASWSINLKRIEGKQRLEGQFQADSGNYGTVYYEW